MKKSTKILTGLMGIVTGIVLDWVAYYLYGSYPNPYCPPGYQDCSKLATGWPFPDPGVSYGSNIDVSWYLNLFFWILLSYFLILGFIFIKRYRRSN